MPVTTEMKAHKSYHQLPTAVPLPWPSPLAKQRAFPTPACIPKQKWAGGPKHVDSAEYNQMWGSVPLKMQGRSQCKKEKNSKIPPSPNLPRPQANNNFFKKRTTEKKKTPSVCQHRMLSGVSFFFQFLEILK